MTGEELKAKISRNLIELMPACMSGNAVVDPDADDTAARKSMKYQLRLIERLAGRIVFFTLIGIVLYVSGGASTSISAIRIFGMFVTVMLAGLVVGGLLGFIFGLPRFLRVIDAATPAAGATAAPSPTTPSKAAFAGNTNLEEISDWLTKIIVGLGLVQAHAIIDSGKHLAIKFSNQIGNPQGAMAMFCFVVAIASVGGFLFFYIETRTRIMLLLTDASTAAVDHGVITSKAAEISIAAPVDVPQGKAGVDTAVRSQSPVATDKTLLGIPYSDLKVADDYAAWGAAQARAGNWEAAVTALQQAISLAPSDHRYLALLADIRLLQGKPQAAVDALGEARIKAPGHAKDLLSRELMSSLYLPQPESFMHALDVGTKLFAEAPEAARDPWINVWLAAAHGQQFDWLQRNRGSEDELAEAKARALVRVREVVRLAPASKHPARLLMRALFEAAPGPSSEDNDLAVFRGDDEFERAILGNEPLPIGN